MSEIIPPTLERIAKGDIERHDGERGGIEFRAYNWPLADYLRRRHISPNQFRAGSQLYHLWRNGSFLAGYAQFAYQEPSRGYTEPDLKLKIPREYLDAVEAVRGQKERRIVVSVCIDGEAAGRRHGMIRLKSALDDLAEHFGYK